MIDQSTSCHGNCLNNALQESFFSHMKYEVNFKAYKIFKEVIKTINDYINYYNNYRY